MMDSFKLEMRAEIRAMKDEMNSIITELRSGSSSSTSPAPPSQQQSSSSAKKKRNERTRQQHKRRATRVTIRPLVKELKQIKEVEHTKQKKPGKHVVLQRIKLIP